MSASHAGEGGPEQPSSLPPQFSLASSDPDQELFDRRGLSDEDIAQIDAMMAAMAALRSAEQELAEASRAYMELGETDMRALRFLIVCENTGTLATPGAIAQHLGISSASTTKLLDRLEAAGHARREGHPADRRARVIVIEPATRRAAMRTVGVQHARRAEAARRLAPAEREVVTRFLEDLARELPVGVVDPEE